MMEPECIFHCHKCPLKFESGSEIKAHWEDVHKLKPADCVYCQKLFPSKGEMESHKIGVHGIACPVCWEKFNSNDGLDSHIKEAHFRTDQYSCHVCQQEFPEYNRQEHLTTCHKDLVRLCQVCSFLALTDEELERHSRVHNVNCQHCDREFSTKTQLKKHRREDYCDPQNYIDIDHPNLKMDPDEESRPTLYLMDTKDKSVKTVDSTHCSICGKNCGSVVGLMKHRKMGHHKRCPCQICQQVFGKPKGLRDQVKVEIWRCPACPTISLSLDESQRHLQTFHESHNCSKCGQIFYGMKAMKMHRRMDNCNVGSGMECDLPNLKRDADEESLPEMKKLKLDLTDTNVRGDKVKSKKVDKFCCSFCGKKFKSKLKLRKHEKVHKKIYPCSICKRMFGKKSGVRNHIKDSHKQKADKGSNSKPKEKQILGFIPPLPAETTGEGIQLFVKSEKENSY